MAKQKQQRTLARYYNPTQKERRRLQVSAYGITWILGRKDINAAPLGQEVGHGDYVFAPVPVIDNKTIFRVEDYPKPKRTKKVVEAEKVEE